MLPASEVIALFGPTAVGKTAVAIELADRLRAHGEKPVAVSADALQVYRGLEILTGVATPEEQQRLEHRLVSFLPLTERFSAGQYATLAHAEVDQLLAAGRRPIVLGGTGLYLRAALADLQLRPPPAPGVRERWTAELAAHGPQALHRQLTQRAPSAAANIAPTDSHRIIRALELLDSGEAVEPAPTRAPAAPPAPDRRSELWTTTTRHPTLLIGLIRERAALYQRIEARIDAMLVQGAQEEVMRAQQAGASETARRALGFAELQSGEVEEMKRRTRNYARRQLTWMRKLPAVTTIDVTERTPAQVADEILSRWLQTTPTR